LGRGSSADSRAIIGRHHRLDPHRQQGNACDTQSQRTFIQETRRSSMNFLVRCLVAGAVIAAGGIALPSQAVTTIYYDDFSGSSGTDLAGTAPDIRPGSETWALGSGDSAIPAQRWKADGSVLGSSSGGGGTTGLLPFTPSAGNIYELSVLINPTTTDGSGDWLALGFLSPSGFPDSPWMFKRGDSGSPAYDTTTFLGPSTSGGLVTGVPSGSQPSPTDFRIVLDTTPALWTVEWFIDGSSVRTATYASNPSITNVGLFRFESAAGSVDNFRLTQVPEPGSLALLGLGLGLLAAHRRARRFN
jgi:PEP-CTERM motif-containing protein